MILVFAGNRTDGRVRRTPRFPATNAAWVGQRLDRLLSALRPTMVVGSAAAGADILILESAAKLQIPAHIVLPFPVQTFRELSVADRGSVWGDRFDRLLDDLPPVQLQLANGDPEDERVYLNANRAILKSAEDIAAGDVIVAVGVRPRLRGATVSVTDDFIARAEALGILVLGLDPGLRRCDMRSAFVVMPYGVKADRNGNQIDCESTFSKVVVPTLESADLDWTRADQQLDAGIVHVGMLDHLARSDVVVVDMATENANAFYELGARHVLRPKTTLLIGPEGTRPVFNVNMLRRVNYRITDSKVSDTDAIDTIRRLLPLLHAAIQDSAMPDSPVYQLFAVSPPVLEDCCPDASPAVDLHRRIDLSTDVAGLKSIANDLDATELPRIQRIELMLRIGVRLRERGAYEESVHRLENLDVSCDQTLLYGWWCQQLALAERRLGEHLLRLGKSPEKYWNRADRRLSQAMESLGDDAETCGIAGGLAKRRALRILRSDRTEVGDIRAAAFLDRALHYYGRGFDKQPSAYYTGINLLTLGRIRTAQGVPPAGRNLDTVAAVTAFYCGQGNGDDFWRAATGAELKLDDHLRWQQSTSFAAVLTAYAEALAIAHPADNVGPIRDQLDLIRLSGADTGGVIEAVLALPEFKS